MTTFILLMTNTIQELTQQKLAIEAELAQAIAQQQQKQEVVQAKQEAADKSLRNKYEEQLVEMEQIIAEVNQAATTLETKLKELTSLRKANGARLPSGQRMRTAFVVPATYEAHAYSIPHFKKEGDRLVFTKKQHRLLS